MFCPGIWLHFPGTHQLGAFWMGNQGRAPSSEPFGLNLKSIFLCKEPSTGSGGSGVSRLPVAPPRVSL